MIDRVKIKLGNYTDIGINKVKALHNEPDTIQVNTETGEVIESKSISYPKDKSDKNYGKFHIHTGQYNSNNVYIDLTPDYIEADNNYDICDRSRFSRSIDYIESELKRLGLVIDLSSKAISGLDICNQAIMNEYPNEYIKIMNDKIPALHKWLNHKSLSGDNETLYYSNRKLIDKPDRLVRIYDKVNALKSKKKPIPIYASDKTLRLEYSMQSMKTVKAMGYETVGDLLTDYKGLSSCYVSFVNEYVKPVIDNTDFTDRFIRSYNRQRGMDRKIVYMCMPQIKAGLTWKQLKAYVKQSDWSDYMIGQLREVYNSTVIDKTENDLMSEFIDKIRVVA